MYRIMLADDEGIVIDSLRFLIEKNYPGQCEIQSAKTGRSVIELAESFRPDIAFMDIQMPGINGIEAMKEIRKINKNIVFIVMSAYDKFDYAKEAINLGVLEYLNKPADKTIILNTLEKAMNLIDGERKKRSQELEIRERMETVIPMIEAGFIYSLLLGDNDDNNIDKYRQLLGIEEKYGFVMVVESGDITDAGEFTNVVGAGVRIQSNYETIKYILKDNFKCVVGPVMTNKIVVLLPNNTAENDYNTRIRIIDHVRSVVDILSERTDAKYKVGIGSVKPINSLNDSYTEAIDSIHLSDRTVAHVKDLPIGCEYEEDYPIDLENALFEAVENGDISKTGEMSRKFFDWLISAHGENLQGIRTKVLEFVLWAERIAYGGGGKVYRFDSRNDYLNSVLSAESMNTLRNWFCEKTEAAAKIVDTKTEEQTESVTCKAKKYIDMNYEKDISLDDVSREVDLSPYYFSKLFKEETGQNFVEYLTEKRIAEAKRLMDTTDMPIKDIGINVGYIDPNYFSRIFKKNVGVTPTEYKN